MRKSLSFIGDASHPNSLLWSSDNYVAIFTPHYIRIIKPSLSVGQELVWEKTDIDARREISKSRGFNELKRRRLMDIIQDEHGEGNSNESSSSKSKRRYEIRICDKAENLFTKGCWSPLGLSGNGGCLLAVLTSTHQILIYEGSIVTHLNHWKLKMDFSSVLEKEFNQLQNVSKIDLLNQCETTSVSWSSIINSTSFIALGSQSGHMSLWVYGIQPKLIQLIPLSSNCSPIIDIAFSSTRNSSSPFYLSAADSSGIVYIFKIEQDNEKKGIISKFITKIDFNRDFAYATCMCFRTIVKEIKEETVMFVAKGTRLYCVSNLHCKDPTVVHVDLIIGMPISSLAFDNNSEASTIEANVFTMNGSAYRIKYQHFSNCTLSIEEDNTILIRDTILNNSLHAQLSSFDKSKLNLYIHGAASSFAGTQQLIYYKTYMRGDLRHYAQKGHEVHILPYIQTHVSMNDVVSTIEDLVFGKRSNNLNLVYIPSIVWDILDLTMNQEKPTQTAIDFIEKLETLHNEVGEDINRSRFINRCINYFSIQIQSAGIVEQQGPFFTDLLLQNMDKLMIMNLEYFIKQFKIYISQKQDDQITDEDQLICSLYKSAIKAQVSTETNPCLNLMVNEMGEIEKRLIRKFNQKPNSVIEMCPICEEKLSFDSLWNANCPKNHRWSRCGFTLRCIDPSRYLICEGCGRKCSTFDRRHIGIKSRTSSAITFVDYLFKDQVQFCCFCGCKYQFNDFSD